MTNTEKKIFSQIRKILHGLECGTAGSHDARWWFDYCIESAYQDGRQDGRDVATYRIKRELEQRNLLIGVAP